MRLLVIEDDPSLAGLIRQGMERAGFAVDVASTAGLARDTAAAARFDVIVLDLGLPDADGLTLLREWRRAADRVPVLILTARDDPDERVAGLDAGADDYVVKPFYMPELASRLRALLRRPGGATLMWLERGNVRLDSTARTVLIDGCFAALTQREFTLLEMLMRGRDRVLTRDIIEEGLYDFSNTLGSNAVDVLVHRLRSKLREYGATATVHALRGVGYTLTSKP